MPVSSPSPSSFLSRLLLPFAMLVLLLSLAANVLLILLRQPLSSSQEGSGLHTVPLSSSASGSLAFGTVSRRIPVVTQTMDSSGALLKPVKGYMFPVSLLPVLPKEFPLYRDQGIALDAAFFGLFFQSVGASIDPVKLQLLPDTYVFRSSDGLLRVSFKAFSRTLVITRAQTSPSPAGASRADDSEVIALARAFADALGLTVSGVPQVIETKPAPDQPGKTLVTWPMMIHGSSVVSADGIDIAAVSIQVGRLAHRALGLEASLLTEDVLVSSLYPVASSQRITSRFLSGGLLPIAKDPKGPMAMIGDLSTVYVLLPQNAESPTYLVPMLKASLSVDGHALRTLVPMLDPDHFVVK